jgi:RHS repeat-associated protein
VGNRLSSLGVSPYSYNSSNELTALPSGSYSYDNNGNTKTKPDGTQYTWDIENELTQVVLPGTGGTVNFKYDPFGRRIQKAFTQNGTTTTTNYVYDGPEIVETLDNSGNLLSRFTQGPGVDQPLAEANSGTNDYYEQDGMGSVTSLSNSSGALANTYTYDSYGKVTAFSGTTVNPFQYTGREFDAETGAYYDRARYYDPGIGRFLSEDPLRTGGLSYYAYANNNPAKLYDPWGLMSWVYNVSYYNTGWGFLGDASTRVDLPPVISVDCQCAGNGQYKATVKVTFTITILSGTQGQLAHEKGHLGILENYLNNRTKYYSQTYERLYSSKEECENAEKDINNDLAKDWRQINQLQSAHDDWLQNAIQWVFNQF